MYLIVLFVATLTATAAQTNPLNWNSIIRQHCDNLPDVESDPPPPLALIPDGPKGPVGVKGPRGETGWRGPPGPTAVLNNARVDEIFQESFASVSQLYPNIKLRETPAGNNAEPAAHQQNREAPVNTEWTVFQRRLDGVVNFYRNWNEYVRGFGSTDSEFWLGLEDIHQQTKSERYELRIDMVAANGTRLVANYDFFKVFPSTDNYRLLVSGYSGNATDALSYHSASQFSTKDQDNDEKVSRNCAERHQGAWWYNRCQTSNLNGRYKTKGVRGLRWFDSGAEQSIRLRSTEMKFRQVA